jgi:hypothetical protein
MATLRVGGCEPVFTFIENTARTRRVWRYISDRSFRLGQIERSVAVGKLVAVPSREFERGVRE